jgi:hypothetical protein
MPAYRTLPREQNISCRRCFTAISMALILITSLPNTLVDASEATGSSGSPAGPGLITDTSTNTAIVAGGPDALLGSSPAVDSPAPRPGKIPKEIGKQTIDQAGHFLIGAAPIWASRHLVGVPWYGWVAAPLLAYREWLQWPSKRWWDPPLDWAFLSLGFVVATCRGGFMDGWSNPLAALRRRIARQSSSALASWSDRPASFGHLRAGLPSGMARRRRALSATARAESPR